MQGYVVQVSSTSSSSTSRYYVLCGDDAEAIRLARSKLELHNEQSVSILRPVASWEIEAFNLLPDEVRQAP
jgi:hypothetical protein